MAKQMNKDYRIGQEQKPYLLGAARLLTRTILLKDLTN